MNHMTRYETASQAAARYNVSTRTLSRWRRSGIGPQWERVGSSVRYPIAVIPATLTVLSDGPVGHPGETWPDESAMWRTVVAVQRLDSTDPAGQSAWLTELRVATDAERDRTLAGLRTLMAAIRSENGQVA